MYLKEGTYTQKQLGKILGVNQLTIFLNIFNLDNTNAADEVLNCNITSLNHLEDFPFTGRKLIGDSLNQYEF